jgi:hypothetical protein
VTQLAPGARVALNVTPPRPGTVLRVDDPRCPGGVVIVRYDDLPHLAIPTSPERLSPGEGGAG